MKYLFLLLVLPYLATPNRAMTPGVVLTQDRVKVCTLGYAGTVRNVPESEKRAVYKEYGILTHKPHEYEVDHAISLELGGSNDIKNLWPESYDLIVNGHQMGAHEKDKLEDKLHSMVCHGQLTLQRAQSEIRGDWTIAYRKYISPTFPLAAAHQGNGALGLHASLQPPVQRNRADGTARVSRPFPDAFGFAESRHQHGIASILIVDGVSDPTAVLGGVAYIVIAAVDSEMRRVSVGESPIPESAEVVLPHWAERNPASAVAGVPRIAGVQADHLHASPDVVEATAQSVLTEVFPLRLVRGALSDAVGIALTEHASNLTSQCEKPL